MRDPRLDKLASVIVNYSCGVQPGWLVRLVGEPVATPLLEALYEQLIIAGANVHARLLPDSFAEIFFEHASEAQMDFINPLALEEVKTVDCSIGLWAETNTKAMSNVDPKKQARTTAARRPISKIFMERAGKGELKWCGTLYPTAASAQDAEMSLREYEDFVFRAGLLHLEDPVAGWREISTRQQKLTDYLNGKKIIHFEAANGTDLTVEVDDMTWINCCGHENFPDGEVFTGPNLKATNGGVNGYVKYHFPASRAGREVHDIELWLEGGKVVKAKASKNQAFLEAMLALDDGASFVGEIAIGTNYSIQQYTKNTLFDEKIGGTFHMAVGAGYPESGNANESGLHWDMVCDLRAPAGGGKITVDGQTISENGIFTNPDWPIQT